MLDQEHAKLAWAPAAAKEGTRMTGAHMVKAALKIAIVIPISNYDCG